jgi:peptidoglycan/xylan/chitin deacetylase (PgdA/CDA1 family)
VRLADLTNYLQTGAPLPPKPIAFTFDDGYQDNLTNAFPLLQKYGFTGAFFLITAFADETRSGYLTWADVQTMHAAGMEFGAHSYNHPDLTGKGLDFLVFQMLGPKQALEQRISEPVIAYCYPLGRYDEQAIAVLRSAHYQVALTTMQGLVHTSKNLLELKRVRVRGSDTVEDLVKRIEYLAALKE